MSLPTPATDEFLARWLPAHNRPNLLVRLELEVPAELTLYWSCDPLHATEIAAPPGGHPWQPVIVDTDPVQVVGDLLTAGPTLAVFGFTVANTRLIPQSQGTASDLLNEYVVKGARVTAWLWEEGMTTLAATLPIFLNGMVQGVRPVSRDGVKFNCKQRNDWKRRIPRRRVGEVYPNAPEGSRPLPLPVILGKFQAEGFDEPWTPTGYPIVPISAEWAKADAGGAGLVVPGILVDAGVGGDDAKILFADHPLKFLGSNLNRGIFVAAGQSLARMALPTALGDESGFTLADEDNVAYVGIPCIDVRVSGDFPNLALNPRAAMEIFDPSSYARITSDGSHDRLTLVVGNIGQPGKMVSAELVIGYRCSHTTTPAAIRYNRPETPGTTLPSYAALTEHTTAPAGQPVVERLNLGVYDLSSVSDPVIPAGYLTTDWNAAAGDLEAAMTSPQAGHYFDVFFIATVVRYEPSQSLVTPEQFVDPGGRGPFGILQNIRRTLSLGKSVVLRNGVFGWLSNPSVYENAGTYFANLQGAEDTDGSATGVTGEVIARPADVIRYLLEEYGQETAIETDVDAFGSFVRARSIQNSVEGNPVELSAHLGEMTNLAVVLERIASQAPCWIYPSRFDDKWRIVPWLRRPAVADFPRRLEPEDILTLEVEDPAETQVESEVAVQYAFDHFRRRFAHSCSVGPDGSDGGWSGRGKRDQRLVVVDSGALQNNRIDILRSAVTYAPSLTAGTYTPAQVIIEAKARLAALGISGAVWNVAWGAAIVASHNDRLDFSMNGAVKAGIIAPGLWTIAEIGPVTQETMQGFDGGQTSPRCGVGMLVLEGFNDQLDFSDGTPKKVTIPPGYYRNGAHLAAVVALSLNAQSSSWTCTYDTGTAKFTIGRSSGTCQLLCLNGVNAAQSAYPLLGFSHAANRIGASSYVADYARNRGRFHIQGKLSIVLLSGTGANRANGAWCALGFDYASDAGSALNHEGAYVLQDETLAITEATAFDLLWASGANVATNAADLLGYGRALDDTGLKRHRADRRRGAREILADESREWFGEKEPLSLAGTEIRTTEVALNTRDTIFDLLHKPPLRLKIRTWRLPDLDVGRILETGNLSGLGVRLPPRYGAGAWDGKLWWCVETSQLSGRAWHQEIVLREVKDPLVGGRAVGADGPVGVIGPQVGTAFAIWADNRLGSSAWRLFACRVEPDGTQPWAANGINVGPLPSSPPDHDRAHKVITDGTGDSISVWLDTEIKVQRLNSSGAAQWTANGLALTVGASGIIEIAICTDAAGGAYVAWRGGVTTHRVRVARIAKAGTFPSGWAINGMQAVTVATDNHEILPRLIPDGSGGVIVVWHNERVDSGAFVLNDIYAQRIDSAGNRLWGSGGVKVSSASSTDEEAALLSDGSGGCFIVWTNNGTSIHSHHVLANGTLDPAWPAAGRTVIAATGVQSTPSLCTDGAGGFIAAWYDERLGAGTPRVFTRRVDAAGVLQWGASIDTMKAQSGQRPYIIPNPTGGAYIVTATDAGVNIRAQRISAAGSLAAWGAPDGIVIGTGSGTRGNAHLAADGDGGLVCIWDDGRNAGNALDIYGQRVSPAGTQLWTANGHPIIQRTADQRMPWIATV